MRLRNRILISAVSFFTAAAVTVSIMPAVTVSAAVTAITTDFLNLREGAGTDKKAILSLSKGAVLTVLDNSDPAWAKVKTVSGYQGYCSKQYLSISGAPNTNTPVNNSSQVATGATAATTSNLNLRSGAGTTYSIIATLNKGTSVKVLDSSNPAWYKVQTADGRQGYCSKQFLQIASTGSPANNTPVGNKPASNSASTAVATDYVNLRQGAGTNFKVIVTVSKGSALKVLDNSNAQWAKVQTADGKQGYCSKQYLKINSGSTTNTNPPANTTPPAATVTTATTTSSLNMRSGAGVTFSVVATLPKGTSLTVLDNSNKLWAKVKTADGKQGYCSKSFLKITTSTVPKPNPTPNVPTTPTDNNNGSPPQNTDNGSNTGTDSGQNAGTGGSTHTITGASVTADLLRLRDQPSTSGKIVANLPKRTSLTVLDTSNSEWVKVQTSGGQTGYVSADYVKIHYSDDPVDSSSNATGLSLSTSSKSIPAGKTLYLKATVNPSDAAIVWTSSNTAVASVANGYVYAAQKGTAVITATSGSYTATCNITVIEAEPVKTAFASPNIASTGSVVTFTAVTDTARDGVRFVITMPGGGTTTLDASNYTEETQLNTVTKKWTATTSFDAAGTYSFTAYSSQNGSMSSTGFTTNAYVSTQQNFTTTSNEDRRASDQMIALISKWEGCRSTVYLDPLTYNATPTIGYGYTFGENALFYNNLTDTEAWSLLVNKINNSSYTSELNKMIKANNFRMSQNQADCLISFAYNVGSGYFNSTSEMDFRRIMKNAVIPPDFSSGSVQGTVTKDTVVYDSPSISASQRCSAPAGTSVTVTKSDFSDTRNGWYGVTLADGSEGWVNSGYINLANSDSLVHDLNYTNAYAFGTDLIRWNMCSGKFTPGLFYRRIGEVNVYNYNDYNAVRSNIYGYTYPNAASGLQ